MHVAFYAEPMDACRVDGEKVRPQPGSFYGGFGGVYLRLQIHQVGDHGNAVLVIDGSRIFIDRAHPAGFGQADGFKTVRCSFQDMGPGSKTKGNTTECKF